MNSINPFIINILANISLNNKSDAKAFMMLNDPYLRNIILMFIIELPDNALIEMFDYYE